MKTILCIIKKQSSQCYCPNKFLDRAYIIKDRVWPGMQNMWLLIRPSRETNCMDSEMSDLRTTTKKEYKEIGY